MEAALQKGTGMSCPLRRIVLALALLLPVQAEAAPVTLCTLVTDAADGRVLLREGKACAVSVTPASTFKIALALMGFETGILTDAHHPVLSWHKGYPAWRASWRQDTDPRRWMTDSVVWYSQVITTRLGAERFAGLTRDFGYGNADVSGDAGADNGLTRSWIGSSLRISPEGQIDFLTRLTAGRLPVSARTVALTREILEQSPQPKGWRVWGKTGAAKRPVADGPSADGSGADGSRGAYGWFVGWAEQSTGNTARRVIFTRLILDTRSFPSGDPPGPHARDTLFADLFSTDGLLR
ncbi:class D beta-lactamase [Tistrella mobilis KA081020-065]|uniref:Beta-lactamase n=2 Tax=Tistrella mobilis TaxID=171437 RepID=I3TR49_TISMK|nr:class D beta-lactamase [Tistrella mobilis KA081020-065]